VAGIDNAKEKQMNAMRLVFPFFAALVCSPGLAIAVPVLGSQLEGFAVLGSSTVTNTGPTHLTGNLGVSAGSAITGFFGTVANDGPGVITGTAYQADATAGLAQTQLTFARQSLGLMAPITALGANLTGLTLTPGVYSVAAGTTNLAGTLTLDGLGNANAAWVFLMPSTLITSSGSMVGLINTGANAGVYWDVGSSATLGSSTSFEGNILASASITLGSGAKMGCGGAFASTGAVTMNNNSVSIGCMGGLTVAAPGNVATALPFASLTPVAAVPEPETYSMILAGLGLLGFAARRKMR
jgi:hypothetical protein